MKNVSFLQKCSHQLVKNYVIWCIFEWNRLNTDCFLKLDFKMNWMSHSFFWFLIIAEANHHVLLWSKVLILKPGIPKMSTLDHSITWWLALTKSHFLILILHFGLFLKSHMQNTMCFNRILFKNMYIMVFFNMSKWAKMKKPAF